MIDFTVKGPLVGINQMYRRGRGWGLYITPRGKAFKLAIQKAAESAMKKTRQTLTNGLCCVFLHIQYQSSRFDVDASVKPILDALQGVVYKNDNQVVKLAVSKAMVKASPFVRVEVFQQSSVRFDSQLWVVQ